MKVITIMMVVTYILGQYLSCATPARNAYVKGLELKQARKYADALEFFEKGLKYEPDSPLLNFYKGECLAQLSRWQEAKDILTRFLELTENDKENWREERWIAEFYIKKARQMLGEEVKSEDTKRFDEDEDYMGGINIVR